MSNETQVMQAALRWHEETGRDECDWGAFTVWLEADPAHRRAYDDVAQLEDMLARRRALVEAASTPAPRRRPVWLAAAAAAVLLVVAAGWLWPKLPFAAQPVQSFVAESGAARRVQLDDGSSVMLAPGSSLSIVGRRQDHIDLEGSAYFDVPHNPNRTLVVTAGGYTIRDIGTRFEVVAGGQQLKVAVAEGEVAVDLPGQAATAQVVAGQRLLVSGAVPVAEYASISAEDVASWREGRLVFSNEPLSLVVQQIARQAGIRMTVDPEIADRRSYAVLKVGDGSQLVARLCEVLGLVSSRDGDVVHLSAADTAR